MKTLLLLRHAKSSWDDPSLADFGRPLASRGVKAAKRMGGEIAQRRWLPDRVLVSPALRTRQTWELVAAGLPGMPAVKFPEALYEASAEEILAEIRKTPETVGSLLVLGHNPGLEDLAEGLAGGDSDTDSLRRLREKFPTAALARLEVEGEWRKLQPGCARLTQYLRPKELD